MSVVFDEDQAPSTSSGKVVFDEPSAGGLAENALDNAGRMLNPLNIAKGLGEQVKTGAFDLPKEATETMAQVVGNTVAGEPIGETPMAKRAVDTMASEPVQNPGKFAYENPLDAAAIMATPVMPFMPEAAEAAVSSDPNILQRVGAGARNNATGISENTVERLAKNENPIKTGVKLANNLEEEGAIGGSKMETLDKVKKLHDEAGESVKSALADIKNESNKLPIQGHRPYDPLQVESNSILKPIIDKANETLKDADPEIRSIGRKWKIMYDSLADKAVGNDGYLTFDDIHSEMKRVGHYFDSDKNLAVGKKLYAHLADLRDQMVDKVAEQSNNPTLAKNLQDANKSFSKYAKVLPDVHEQALKSAVGKDTILSGARPFRAGIRAAEPLLGKLLLGLGNKVAKYGPTLKAAAAKGTQNLMMTDYLLKQSDPDYPK